MICGTCGEELIQIPLIRPIQIFALITIAAFISPLVMIILTFNQTIKQPIQKKVPINSAEVIKT